MRRHINLNLGAPVYDGVIIATVGTLLGWWTVGNVDWWTTIIPICAAGVVCYLTARYWRRRIWRLAVLVIVAYTVVATVDVHRVWQGAVLGAYCSAICLLARYRRYREYRQWIIHYNYPPT